MYRRHPAGPFGEPSDPAYTPATVDPNAVILIALALALFIAELKISTQGVLTTLGMVALAIGAALLIRDGTVGFGAGPWLVAGTVLVLCVVFGLWTVKVAQTRKLPPYPGLGPSAGQGEDRHGVARTDLDPSGEVFVGGALWNAKARGGAIPAGSSIIVVGRRGLVLEVEPPAVAAAGSRESR